MKKQINQIFNCNLLNLTSTDFSIIHGLNYVNKDDPNIMGPHVHDGYEIFINVSGDVSFLIKNKLYPVKKGELAVSLPNDVHHCVYNKSGIFEHFVLWIKADNTSPFFNFINKENFIPLIVFEEKAKEKLIDKFFKLHNLCLDGEKNKLYITTTLMEILTIINMGENLIEINDIESEIPKNFEFILEKTKENLSIINTVKDLAEICFISTATINRWFRKYLHLSPKEYLEIKKLSLAKQLMANGATVTEAALEAGFYDASHFISVFKKKFKETPKKHMK
ncbi:MAG: helix-turn-helix domain-containing protein [Clostridia bacterium]|nr:helix-turn-helix domain-containing protein [Clostridia bacterium]